jgi:hypothetical protein
MVIAISPAATVNAGPDQITCAVASPIQLAGGMGGAATSTTWSGGSGSYSPNASSLNASYTPSAADLAAGSVTLTLTTNDPAGPCGAVSDQVKITFDSPKVSVSSRTVCYGMSPVTLSASASNGIPPYTYRWSNGATASSITVADTGSYAVTITDAKGCTASGSGRFRQRECTGLVAHTSTTCSSFIAGTGDELLNSDIKWNVSNNVITNIAPGVFFYFTRVQAPSADFRVELQQIKTDSRFPYCDVFQDQVTMYDENCGSAGSGAQTTAGQAAIDVHGAQPGHVYIISVKYSLKNLIGTYMDPTMGCHYDFHTVINGLVVDADPDGFWIGMPQQVSDGGGSGGSGGGSDGSGGDGGADGIVLPGGHGGASGPGPAGGTGGGNGGSGGGTSSGSGRAALGGSDAGSANGATGADGMALERPVPNPFTSGMRMAYAVSGDNERVEISVYDLAGRHMKTLASGIEAAGRHDVAWDGRDESGARVRRGMYFIHIRIGAQARQVRVTFVN